MCSVSCTQKNRHICGETNCALRLKWRSKLAGETKDLEYASKLSTIVAKQKTGYDQQIDKDAIRSFPQRLQPKTKITLYHACE